jgi:hypothetical protein
MKTLCAWSKQEDDAVIAKLAVVQDKLARQGKLGPVVRPLPTTAATTLRKDREQPLVIDGPFAETKEQLLGFYPVECASLAEVLQIARQLGAANPGGAYEIGRLRQRRQQPLPPEEMLSDLCDAEASTVARRRGQLSRRYLAALRRGNTYSPTT